MDPRTPVSDVMQTEVATLGPGERLDLAEDVMHLGRIRHLPVLDGARLVGLVSSRDLLAASLTRSLEFDGSSRRAFMRAIEVNEVMTREVVTVAPDATLRDAARKMLEAQIGCVPVVESDGTLRGLITETDLLRVALIEPDDEINLVVGESTEEERMSELGEKLEEEIESLKRTRDELKVQMNLAKAEAQDLWARMEHKFQEVESQVKLTKRDAEEPLRDAGNALRALVHEIGEGYKRIRQAL
jgi:CBS domain-containing protein